MWRQYLTYNSPQKDISEEERRAAEGFEANKVLSFSNNMQEKTGRKIALATAYHREGQFVIPRCRLCVAVLLDQTVYIFSVSAVYKKKETEAKGSEHDTRRINYYGDYKPPLVPLPSNSRVGFPGMFSAGPQYQHRGVLYPNPNTVYTSHTGYGQSGITDYEQGAGGYFYPSQYGSGGTDHTSFFKKQMGLKGLLIPLAGIAILGAAAALTANPLLLQLGTLSGRRRRRSVEPHILDSNIYPINPLFKPNKK
ncbi:hypothetical protein FQA39_LY04400 [Lamprigera yunnana]|nr:hypothetical protein FQA39_LY04400 [Lamprigera yunnana]